MTWLASTHSVEYEPVTEDKWQRILNEQHRLSAEQKLNGWLVKPTDGIFAQNEPENFNTDQPPDHSIPDHTQHGQPVHSGCELRSRLSSSRSVATGIC